MNRSGLRVFLILRTSVIKRYSKGESKLCRYMDAQRQRLEPWIQKARPLRIGTTTRSRVQFLHDVTRKNRTGSHRDFRFVDF